MSQQPTYPTQPQAVYPAPYPPYGFAYPAYPAHSYPYNHAATSQIQGSVPQSQHIQQSNIQPSNVPARGRRNQSSLKGVFTKDLKSLMYGLGDDFHCAPDTVSVMEEILIEYIGNVCLTALAPTKKSRLQIEDLRRVLSRPADAKKLARMEELLFMQEDIKRARQQFEEDAVPTT